MPKRKMTDAHKKAIKKGRAEAAIVKAYLESLATSGQRSADPKAIQRRLNAVESKLRDENNKLRKLELIQQKMNLEKALEAAGRAEGTADLEKEFIRVAAPFAARKGLSYKAYRGMGVPPAVLKKAGIKRTRG